MRTRCLVAFVAAVGSVLTVAGPAGAAVPGGAAQVAGGGVVDHHLTANHWMATVDNANTIGCSGVLITKYWLLSQIGCLVQNGTEPIRVTAGGVTRKVTFTAMMPNSWLAVARLDHPVTTVGTMALADQDPPMGAVTPFYGAGEECDFCGEPGHFRQALLVIAANDQLDPYVGPLLEQDSMWGVPMEGDHGGGRFYNGALVGVLYSTRNQFRTGSMSLSVARSRPWIVDTMAKNPPPRPIIIFPKGL